MQSKVAIVGGGLAGLRAASRLHAAGVTFDLFEARGRLGGRILTADASGQPSSDGFDLGPSWFWPRMQPEMAAIIQEFGLPAFPQQDVGDVVVERYTLEAPRRFQAMRQEPSSMRLAGGTGALVTALAAGLPPARVHLGVTIAGLRLSGDSVILSAVDRTGTSGTAVAAQIILALPPRLLAERITFDPPFDPQTLAHWRDTATWMAPHAKFFALYDRPFWREAGLSGDAQSFVGPLVEIHDATTASGQSALFGFVGMDAAQRATVGEQALTAAAIGQLTRLFGPDAANPSATLFKDWSTDSLTATPADRTAAVHPAPSAIPWLTGPWAGRATLAGSETSATFPGYLAGAVDAGEWAARETLLRLGDVAAKETISC